MSNEAWTIGRVTKWATDDFKSRGIDSPRLDAELLLGAVLGIDRIQIITQSLRPLSPAELASYRDLIKRRRNLEPVAYLLGRREFYGRPFQVDASVLIPRPDTEILVEVALRRTAPCYLFGRAVDLCTGSGCVAVSFARERPNWYVDGADLSPEAVANARQNALRLGAIWNVRWVQGDLFAPLGAPEPRYDLITANPPYIPAAEIPELDPGIRDFEPRMALTDEADGLRITQRIVREAPAWLAPGGVLALEIMAGTSAQVAAFLTEAGLVDVEITKDYGGHDRVVSGKKA